MYNLNQFRTIAISRGLSDDEIRRQYWVYQNKILYTQSLLIPNGQMSDFGIGMQSPPIGSAGGSGVKRRRNLEDLTEFFGITPTDGSYSTNIEFQITTTSGYFKGIYPDGQETGIFTSGNYIEFDSAGVGLVWDGTTPFKVFSCDDSGEISGNILIIDNSTNGLIDDVVSVNVKNCTLLTRLNLNNSSQLVGSYNLSRLTALEYLDFGDCPLITGVVTNSTSLKEAHFYNCVELSYITLNGVTGNGVGNISLTGCSSLSSLTLEMFYDSIGIAEFTNTINTISLDDDGGVNATLDLIATSKSWLVDRSGV